MSPTPRRTISVPIPRDGWFLARALSVGGMVGLAYACWVVPATGLPVLWGLVVPALPIFWVLAPGLWRNVCPMASVNQVPRRARFTRGLALPPWLERHGFAIGATAFFVAVSLRPVLFQTSGPASAVLLIAALVAAFAGGSVFRGKSGFCGSVCPLRAPQASFSRAPAVVVANSHCQPCVGCTTNCVDLTPKRSWLADLVMPDGRADARWLFSGLMPGFVHAFWLLSARDTYGDVLWMLTCWSLASLGLFTLVGSVARVGRGRLTALAGAASLGLFYWSATPVVVASIESLARVQIGPAAMWEARGILGVVIATWLVRSLRLAALERVPVATSNLGAAPARVGAPLGAPLPMAGDLAPTTTAAPKPEPVPIAGDGLRPAAVPAAGPTGLRPLRPGADLTPPVLAGNPPVRIPDRRSADRLDRPPTVTFWPEGAAVEVTPERPTVAAAARELGIALPDGCGSGLCGCDPVYVISGADGLAPAASQELATLGRLGLPEHVRLACAARVIGDVVVSLAPAAAGAAAQPDLVDLPDVADLPDAADLSEPLVGAPTEATVPAPRPVLAPAAAPSSAPRPPVTPAIQVVAPPGPPDVQRVVIVGNGVAGITAASHVRRLHPGCQIDLISRSAHPFYNRIAIARLIHRPQGLGGLQLMPDSWYDNQRITQWLNTTVSRIDRERRDVVLGTGQRLPYDRLILATGAGWAKPPLPGVDLPGVFGVREAADAMKIRAYAQSVGVRRAAVLGGGLLGLEIAEALHKLGIEVTVLERGRQLAESVLDKEAGRLLRRHVETRGITVRTGSSVAALRGTERLEDIVFEDGRAIDVDLAVVCVGITPDVTLARDAGLEIGRGIVVDEQMRTSDPAILACGDAAEFARRVGGHWAIGAIQAEVAAVTTAGGRRYYRSTPVPTVLKLDDVEVVSIGDITGGGTVTRVVEISGDDHYRVTYRDGDRPVGLVAVNGGPEVDRTVDAIIQGASLPDHGSTITTAPAEVAEPAAAVAQPLRGTA